MATLKADIEKREEAVRILCEILPQFDDLKYDVNNIASELNSTWDGAASNHFITKLRSHAKPLGDTQEALVYFKEYAEEAKYSMKKLDEICQVITAPYIVPTVAVPTVPTSTTTTSSSGTTHGGGGKTTSSSSNKKTSSNSKKESKNVVEKAIDAVTSSVKKIANGIKSWFGGK